MFAGLFPERIDLGVGRAAGTDPTTTFALQRDRRQAAPDDFRSSSKSCSPISIVHSPRVTPLPDWLRSRGGRSAPIHGCSGPRPRAVCGRRTSACPMPSPISSLHRGPKSPKNIGSRSGLHSHGVRLRSLPPSGRYVPRRTLKPSGSRRVQTWRSRAARRTPDSGATGRGCAAVSAGETSPAEALQPTPPADRGITRHGTSRHRGSRGGVRRGGGDGGHVTYEHAGRRRSYELIAEEFGLVPSTAGAAALAS